MKQPNTDKQKAKTQKSENPESGATEKNPQAAAEKPSQDKPATEKKSSPHNSGASASSKKAPRERSQPAKQRLAWVAIALTLGLAATIYWHGHQQVQTWQQQNQALIGQIDSLKASLSEQAKQNISALNQAKENTDILIAQQQQSIEALQRAIQEQQGRRPNDWLIAEAHYLVNLAGKNYGLKMILQPQRSFCLPQMHELLSSMTQALPQFAKSWPTTSLNSKPFQVLTALVSSCS